MFTVYLGVFVKMLQDIFGALFGAILEPFFIVIFNFTFSLIKELLWPVISSLLFTVLAIILGMLDFIEQIFDILTGTRAITSSGNSTYLVNIFLENNDIQMIIWRLTIFAFALSVLFSIYAVMMSVHTSVLNEREHTPVGKILRNALKGCLHFLLVPIMVVLVMKLSTLVLIQINNAVSQGSGGYNPTIGTLIFLANSMDAASGSEAKSYPTAKTRQAARSIFGNDKQPSGKDYINNPSMYDTLRLSYYIGEKSYSDVGTVLKDFNIENYHLISAFTSAVLVLAIMLISALLAVRGMMEVIILYVAAPLSVATYPLDGGKMYDSWKGTFVGRAVYCYGMVISMKIFIMLTPVIMSPKVKFFVPANEILDIENGGGLGYGGIFNSLTGLIFSGASADNGYSSNMATTVDFMIRTFIIIGGAYSVFRAQHLIFEIVSEAAAQGVKNMSNAMGAKIASPFMKGGAALAKLMVAPTKMLLKAGGKGIKGMLSADGSKGPDSDGGSGGDSGGGAGGGSDQAFTGGNKPGIGAGAIKGVGGAGSGAGAVAASADKDKNEEEKKDKKNNGHDKAQKNNDSREQMSNQLTADVNKIPKDVGRGAGEIAKGSDKSAVNQSESENNDNSNSDE